MGGTKQWGTDTLGDLWKGEGWDGEHGEEKMDMTGTFRKESRGIEGSGLGWIIGGRKAKCKKHSHSPFSLRFNI